MNIPRPAERLAFFARLYDESRERNRAREERFERALAQYEGLPDREGGVRTEAVRNITYELIESEVATDIPAPHVEPLVYSEEADRCAKSVERLCLRVLDELPFERLNDQDERYTYVFGGSVWLLEWDEERGKDGGLRISCVDPRDFIPEGGVTEVEDMSYCFFRFRMSREELLARYGLREEAAERVEAASEDPSGETVEVRMAFYRDEKGQIGRFVFSGDVVLSDEEDFYARRDGEGNPLPAGRAPYYRPSALPVVLRRNVTEPGSLFGRSDAEMIRHQQTAINRIETRIQQKLLRSGVTPMLPEGTEITLTNAVFGEVIRLRPGDDRGQLGVLDTTPDISADVMQAERLYDQAKRILGITDSYLGIGDKTAQSGIAKQVQVEQAAGRLQSKRRLKQAAYAELFSHIFRFYLAFADTPRPVSFVDAWGHRRGDTFSAYRFLRMGEEGLYFDDGFLFSVDHNGAIEQQRDAMWQKNLENLTSGALGDPGDPATLLHYWQCQERVHYPYARENAEYFRDLVERKEAELPRIGEDEFAVSGFPIGKEAPLPGGGA